MKREPGWVYGTKVTNRNGEAWGGFQWPDSGVVECPDWNPEPVCGGGLHFFEDGCGDLTAAQYVLSPDAQWRLVRARDEDVVRLDGKVKARRVEVLLCGDGATVCGEMSRLAPGRGVHFGTSTSGDYGTSTSGNHGTSTSGYRGIIQIKHWDGHRPRMVTGYVGENGIEPNTPYRLDADGNFVPAGN